MQAIMRALKSLLRRRQAERDMEDELRSHLEMEARELERQGVPGAEARRRAAIAFGAVEAHKEDIRDARAWAWLDDLWRDARYSIRQLRRTPGFSAVVVLTLSVGIASTSAMFSIVDSVLLRPLPYAEPDRLVAITGLGYKGEFVQLRDQARTLSVGAYSAPRAVTLTGRGDPIRITAAPATPEMFGVLGVRPALGRAFTAEEGRPGATPAVVLSRGAWQRLLGGAPDVTGQQLTIDGTVRTVVGVMPAGFAFPDRNVDIWTPLVIRESDPIDLWAQSATMIGRLRENTTVEAARAEIAAQVPRFRTMFPWKMPADYGSEVGVVPLQEHVVGPVARALVVLLAAVAVVLAIVCVNVANLMLARAMVRQREMAIRGAIGAGARRLFRQMMAESLTLAAIAGTLGFLLAWWIVRAVTARLPADMPRVDEIGLDVRVFAFTCAISIAAGFLSGLWPALRSSMMRSDATLREAGRSSGLARGSRTLAQILVVAEIAMVVVLVTSAALLVQSFRNLIAVDPGFRTERLLTATVAPPPSGPETAATRLAFIDELLERLRRGDGVLSVSASTAVPLGAPAYGAVFAIEGRPDPATQSGEWPLAHVAASVEPEFFSTMAMPLEVGRTFSGDDGAGSPPVAVVSRSLAARYWPDGSPIGARVRMPGAREWTTIVGVVGDVKWSSLTEDQNRALYRPLAQSAAEGPVAIVARTDRDPMIIGGSLRAIVTALDPDTAVSDIRTADALVRQSVAKPRFTASLLALFAIVALFLGAIGVYGVFAYTVSRRSQEIGVRMALGARTGDVLRVVLGEGAAVALVGIAIGLGGALIATRALATLLFGISPSDPTIYGVAAAMLMLTALLASWIPARRAMRVNPRTALLGE